MLPLAIARYLDASELLADAVARRHVWDSIRDFRDGQLREDCAYYSMELRRNVRVCDPTLLWHNGAPRGMREGLMWDDAGRLSTR